MSIRTWERPDDFKTSKGSVVSTPLGKKETFFSFPRTPGKSTVAQEARREVNTCGGYSRDGTGAICPLRQD